MLAGAADQDGRPHGHAGLHGARAVRGQESRRAHRSVRVLRRALRGPLRRAPVPGRHRHRRWRRRSFTGVTESPSGTPRFPGGCGGRCCAGSTSIPNRRFPQLDDLIAVLANDPAKRTRAWMAAGSALVVMLAAVGVAHRMGAGQRAMCTGAGARLRASGSRARTRPNARRPSIARSRLRARATRSRPSRAPPDCWISTSRGGRGCTPMPVRRRTSAASSRRRCWICAWRASTSTSATRARSATSSPPPTARSSRTPSAPPRPCRRWTAAPTSPCCARW